MDARQQRASYTYVCAKVRAHDRRQADRPAVAAGKRANRSVIVVAVAAQSCPRPRHRSPSLSSSMHGCRRRGSPVASSGNARYHRQLPGSGDRCCGLAYMKRGTKEKGPPRTAAAVVAENHRRRVVAVDTASRVGGRSDETTRN